MNTTETSLITKQPGRCGGAACVRDTRITVWGLVSWRRQGVRDETLQEMIVGLTPADLDAAWKYAAEHPEDIDRLIQDNEQSASLAE